MIKSQPAHQIQSYEYKQSIQHVPKERCLLTIKLAPCTLALRGPWDIDAKRKIHFNKKQ